MSDVEELDAVIHALATVGVAMSEGDAEAWRTMAAGLAQAREAVLATHQAGASREGILAMLMAAYRALPANDARRHGWLLRAVTMRLEADDLPRGPSCGPGPAG